MNAVPRGCYRRISRCIVLSACLCAAVVQMLVMSPPSAWARKQEIVWSAQGKPIYDQIKNLRSLPDDVRARSTKDIALEIRALPASENKLRLANYLASRATEGDFGHDTLQEVATTLAGALQQAPPEDTPTVSLDAYDELAQLVRYEHVQTSLDAPQFKAAMAKLEVDDLQRQKVDFTLTDLQAKFGP